MRLFILLLVCVFATHFISAQSIGVGTDTPDSSALLDLSSSAKGMLIPRMTAAQRDSIPNPADGLLVYVTQDSTFYCFDGRKWGRLNTRTRELIDADEDTKVMVESTPDEDIIHFETSGISYFRFDAGRLAIANTGKSIFIGEGAGVNDDLTENANIALGDSALFNNSSGYNNIGIGRNVLRSNTSGIRNIGIGTDALKSNISGTRNTATGVRVLHRNIGGGNNSGFGYEALFNNNLGYNNTSIGQWSMFYNETGANNTALGMEALAVNKSGNYNVAIGQKALYHNLTSANTAIGYEALYSDTTGTQNLAAGIQAMFLNTSGSSNSALGAQAMRNNTTGNWNAALGAATLYSNTTGSYNTATGSRSLEKTTTGGGNTASGHGALFLNSTGGENVAIGNRAIRNGTISSYNTALGSYTMLTNTKGNYNTTLGYRADVGNDSLVNATAIGANSIVNTSNSLVLGDSMVNVGIGTGSPTRKLHVAGTSLFENPNGVNLLNAKSSDPTGTWLNLYNSTAGSDIFSILYTGTANSEGAGKMLLRSNQAFSNGLGIPITITNEARVGIRVTSPLTSLDARSEATDASNWISAVFGPISNGNRVVAGNLGGTATIGAHNTNLTSWTELAINPDWGEVGIGTRNPAAQVSIGEWNAGWSGDSIQLKLSGTHNQGSNLGSINGTYKLKIEGYQNDGLVVYPLHVMDENEMTDFYLRNRIGNSNLPLMYFAGQVGIGTEMPSTIIGNSKMDVVGGHIAVSNNFGVLSYNSTNTGIGAGFDTGTDDDLYLYAGGALQMTLESATGDLTLHNGNAFKPGGGNWTAISDIRFKDEIRPFEDGLNKIAEIDPVTFHYNSLSGFDTRKEYVGVIAQQLEEVAPYMVSSFNQDGDAYLQVDNSAMTYMLVNAVKELKTINDKTMSRLSELENENVKLRAQMDVLIKRIEAVED
jgi:hypothetical protein